MSAQGGTLGRRGIVHLPVLPIVVALVAVAAAIIVLSIPNSGTSSTQVTRVGDLTRFTNSTAAVREQGGSLPFARPFDTSGIESASLWTPAQAEAYQAQLRYEMQLYQGSSAAIREQGGTIPAVWGVSHVSPRAGTFAGFENPNAYVDQSIAVATGLENPGAYGTGGPEPRFRPHGAFGG
jgi:hypothetical protein